MTYALDADDVKLLLEIYAEHVELACIAYYMDMGTKQEAEGWVKCMDALLPRYCVPVTRIQRHRMWARVLVLKNDLNGAYEHLKRGFDIAKEFHIPFRAADCCNQITGMMRDALKDTSFSTDQNLLEALSYGQYSITYYQQLKTSNHHYLEHAVAKQTALMNEWVARHGSKPQLLQK